MGFMGEVREYICEVKRNSNRFLFLCVYISPCTGNIYEYMETFSPNYKLIMW